MGAEEIGFKFGAEIECLKVFRTEDEIKKFETEYNKELEADKKQIAQNQNKNKYERNFSQKRKDSHPNDIDRRRLNRNDRDYRKRDRSRHRRSHSRNRRRSRSNEGYEAIDYGLKRKADKIKNYIDDKYDKHSSKYQRKKYRNNGRYRNDWNRR